MVKVNYGTLLSNYVPLVDGRPSLHVGIVMAVVVVIHLLPVLLLQLEDAAELRLHLAQARLDALQFLVRRRRLGFRVGDGSSNGLPRSLGNRIAAHLKWACAHAYFRFSYHT